jgi:prolyl-tRNA editing enzyme YbaK/EbsC (Cys-tRNA(Pro) deacylase)
MALHPNAERVTAAALELGISIEVVTHPQGARTAEDAAAAVGVHVGQIVKSLIFAVDDVPVLALVSGPNRLDEAKLAVAFDGSLSKRLDANAVRTATGYPIGGIPPFGHATSLEVRIDQDLMQYEVVWAAAGTPNDVFAITPEELAKATGGTIADLC